jgi:hypothetical protein
VWCACNQAESRLIRLGHFAASTENVGTCLFKPPKEQRTFFLKLDSTEKKSSPSVHTHIDSFCTSLLKQIDLLTVSLVFLFVCKHELHVRQRQ